MTTTTSTSSSSSTTTTTSSSSSTTTSSSRSSRSSNRARLRRELFASLALAALAPLAACDDGDSLDDLDEFIDQQDAAQLALDVDRIAALDAEIPLDELSEDELALLAPEAGPSQTVNHIVYSCNIDVLGATTDCDPFYVDANEFDPGEWTADVRMLSKAASFRRMDVYTEICDPSAYAFSIADSPSANGWGGDSGHADHDAEMHFYGTGAQFFSTTDHQNGAFANHSSLGSAHAGGCQVVHTVTYHALGTEVGVMSIDGGGSPLTIRDTRGLKLGYETCTDGPGDPARGTSCDFEDEGLQYAHNWHIGLNRTIGSGSRDGSGVQRACVVLNTDVSAKPESCLGPAQTAAVPENTNKFCISAGTPAQMLAECEADAATVTNLYLNGTFSTNDYNTHWVNPCPAGTSVVPNSQFYAQNSCNPRPNLGPGCAGAGSFNYEFKIGAMCQ